MVRATRGSRATARDWYSLVKEEGDGSFDQWKEMRAQFDEQWMHQSLKCSLLEQQRVRVVSSAEALGRQLLREQGVDESALRLSDIGCLRTDPGKGEQEIHSDVQEKQYSSVCYFLILYLHPTESTAVANVPAGALDSVWMMTNRQAATRFSSVQFITERVEGGDALLMQGTSFHYAVKNPDSYRRYVGFLSFTPKRLPPFDSQLLFYPLGVPVDDPASDGDLTNL
jgi:hypothetical protein